MTLQPPGFFGKVPARGDFVARRMPTGLTRVWDEWLGTLTISVRNGAATDWPEVWLTAPLWHFALGASIAPPQGAAGVLVASVDRVGRMFPFTVIGPSLGIPDQEWSASVEALVLDALSDAFSPDVLDAALVRLGAPPPGATLEPACSFWASRGSARVPPTARLFIGLPGGADAMGLVLGWDGKAIEPEDRTTD